MIYRAVNDLCLVDFDDLGLPMVAAEAIEFLEQRGFRAVKKDIIALGREAISQVSYRRNARVVEAPNVFNCSSLTKWLYGEIGVWLPRRAIQQREFGVSIDRKDVLLGDLVFASGYRDLYDDDPNFGVGHVGIMSGLDSVIRGVGKTVGLAEGPLGEFLDGRELRGIRRIANLERAVTFRLPEDSEIETSDDIRWLILMAL